MAMAARRGFSAAAPIRETCGRMPTGSIPGSVWMMARSRRGYPINRGLTPGPRDAWPYVHEYAPPNAKDVHIVGTLEIQDPADGAAEVVLYRVSSGKRFYLRAVLLSANVAVLPGAALFTVDRNSPVGVTNLQYM